MIVAAADLPMIPFECIRVPVSCHHFIVRYAANRRCRSLLISNRSIAISIRRFRVSIR
jgi:hypothetical protein